MSQCAPRVDELECLVGGVPGDRVDRTGRGGLARADEPEASGRAAERTRMMQRVAGGQCGQGVRVGREGHFGVGDQQRVRRRAREPTAERAAHVAAAERRRLADHHRAQVARREKMREQVALLHSTSIRV